MGEPDKRNPEDDENEEDEEDEADETVGPGPDSILAQRLTAFLDL